MTQKSRQDLLRENEDLRLRLAEAERAAARLEERVELLASPAEESPSPVGRRAGDGAAPYADPALLKEIAERRQAEEELRKLNRTLRALSTSSQTMMRAREESQYLKDVCRIVVEDCGHAMVWVGFAEEDEGKTVRPVAYSGFEEGYLETLKLTWADTERGRGPTGTVIRTGTVASCRNMLTDPLFTPWREEAIKRGYAASIALPLRGEGRVFGALMIYSRHPDPFSEDEVRLLSELADDLAYGITALRLRLAHARAEERAQSLARFPSENPAPIWRIARDGTVLHANAACEPLLRAWGSGTGQTAPDPWRQLASEALASGSPKLSGVQHGDRIYSFAVVPIAQEGYANLYGTDVTEREGLLAELKHLQQELRSANTELERRVEERTAQLATANQALQNANEALRRSEELIRTVFETLPVGVWVADPDGRITLSNPAGRRIWAGARYVGLDQYGEYKGWWADTGEPIAPDEWALARAVQRGETSLDERVEIEGFDGTRRTILNSAVPLRDPQGALAGGIVINQDITPRVEAELRTRATNTLLAMYTTKNSRKEYLDGVVELLRDWTRCQCAGVRVLDPEGNIPYESHCGFGQDFWESENWLSVRADQCACIRVVLGSPDAQDLPVMTPGGSFRCSDALRFVSSLTDEQKARFRGKCVANGYASVVVIPIRYRDRVLGAIHLADPQPERVPAKTVEFIESLSPIVGEAILRFTAEEALRRAGAYNRSLIEASPDPLVTIGPDGKITDVNRATEEATGCSRQELVGTDFSEYFTDPAAARAGYREAFDRGYVRDYPLELRHRDGHHTPVLYNASVYRDESGQVIGVFAAARDIAERKRLENELIEISHRERRRIGQDLHDVLGQHLTGLVFMAEMLQGKLEAKSLPEATDAARIGTLLDEAVRQVRALSRGLCPVQLEADGLMVALEDLAHSIAERSGVACHFECPTPVLVADNAAAIHLFHIAQEAVNNALKHGQSKGIHVRLTASQDKGLLSIHDDGVGFAPGQDRKNKLGLHIMSYRASMIGGSLDVQSGQGQGTRVACTFPYRPATRRGDRS